MQRLGTTVAHIHTGVAVATTAIKAYNGDNNNNNNNDDNIVINMNTKNA
jgi:hypothetical protein